MAAVHCPFTGRKDHVSRSQADAAIEVIKAAKFDLRLKFKPESTAQTAMYL